MESSFASRGSVPLADVTLAWKSLQKAKAVVRVLRLSCVLLSATSLCTPSAGFSQSVIESHLQGIENKFCRQTRSRANPQAARGELWNGESCDGKRSRDETALKEKNRSEVPVSCRKRNCAALSPAGSHPRFRGSCAASPGPPMAPLAPRGHPPTAPAGMGAADGTQPPALSLREDFGEWVDSGGHTVQKGKHPCSPHHTPCPLAGSSPFSAPVPVAVLLPVCYPSSASSPSDQKLDGLPRKSPWKKLEQLKKKIQEQKKQNQQAASQGQKCLTASCAREPLQDRPLKRKVCRLPAPPAPRPTDQRKSSSARGTQTQSQRQPSPKSSSLERAAAGEGAKLPGASAWREGQKLARKILGPPPAFPKLGSRAEEQSTGNAYEPGIATPAMENSSREKRKEPVGKRPELQSCAVPHHGPAGRSSSAPTKGAKQILRSLHLQRQCHDGRRQSRIPGDTAKGKVLQQYQPPSAGPQDTAPSTFSAGKIRAALITAGAKPCSSGRIHRGKSTSPRGWMPVWKGSEKENLKHLPKRRTNIKKPHPYSRDVVQEFMCRKNEERKRRKLEEKKALMQAVEMRNKRLQEVYRKQREALGKKTCSEQTCKLIGGAAAAKGSPQRTLEQEQTSGGTPERSIMAWVEKASRAPLHRDPRDRDQLLETVQSLKNRDPLPSAALLTSESWLPSPLKCQDLRDCSPPALYAPPLSFSPPQKDAKPDFKDLTSGLSPYRNKWDRVKAIHDLSKELAEKIEMATKRLSATSSGKDSADKISAETTWDLFNESSVPEPETSKDEQDGTMTVQMLLGAPGHDELHVPSDRECHGPSRICLVDSNKGTADLDRENKIGSSLSGGSAVSKELPWITYGIRQRHPSTGENMSSTLKGFPVNKGSEVDMSLLHEKPITSPASPSHGFLARSPRRDPAARRCEAVPGLQDRGAAAQCHPTTESLRTAGSHTLQPHGAEQHSVSAGEGDPSCAELKEKHRSHLDNLRQTSLLLAHRLKAHQLQQKQQLTVLSEKAKLELQESQRFLTDLLQNDLKLCSSSKGRYSSVPKLDHAEQTRAGHQSAGDSTAGSDEEMHLLKQLPLNMERDHSPEDSKTVGQRKSLRGRSSHGSALHEGSLLAEDTEPLHGHQGLNLLSPPVELPHGEPCTEDGSGESSDQASQWSDVSRHYGRSSSFCCFSLAMAEQCLRGEELRARHQAALLELRRKALRDKARAELAWLGHQRRCLEILQDTKGASAVAEKQRKVLTELKREQVEIQHLQNIYRAAHQERKLLLKQQREILMMRQSTAKLQDELHHLTGKKKLSRSPATEEIIKPKMRQISSAMLDSSLAESTRPYVPGHNQNCVQLKNKQSKKYDGFSTKNKKTLVQYQELTEEPLSLEQSLGAQGPDACGTVAKKVCDATSQTTGDDTPFLEDQEDDSVTVEKAPREQRSRRTSREEEDSCSPFQAGTRKKDLSFDDQDSEKRSAPISSEATVMKTQLRKESSLDEPRGNPDSERKSQIMHAGEKAPSEILFSEDVPHEVEMSAPCKIHQVDGSQCLKSLDHNYQETSDEELHLKAFSEGLASTESLSKSNNFSPSSENARSDCSLPDFQKVSAVWIDVSECSISDFELEVQNGEDTDVSIPEEFLYDAFPNTPKETPLAIDSVRKTLHSDEQNEHGVPKDDSSTEISSHSQNFKKYPAEASAPGCTGHLLSFLPTDKANTSKTMLLNSSQFDKPAKGMDKPHLEASENLKNAAASSLCSDDIYQLQIYQQHNPNSITNSPKRNGGIDSLLEDQNLPLMESLNHLNLSANQFSSTVSFPPDKDIANDKLVACLSSRNAAVQNNHVQLLNEKVISGKLDKVVSLPLSTQGIPQEVHTEICSSVSLQRLVSGTHNNSKNDRQAAKELGNEQFSSITSKKQTFQSENSFRSGDDTIFISDEGLPPADEDTLSEILSPVDEVLSYGSADLPSSNRKDLSFPSEDLPPPPLGEDTMKNDDSSFSMDDFPSPPEQMTVSETGQCMNEDILLKVDAFPPLPDNIVTEEYPLLNQEPVDIFSIQEHKLSEQYLVEEDISCAKDHLSEYQEGEREMPSQSLELLPVPNPLSSSQVSENPASTMKRCKTYLTLPVAEEDSDDPLSSFEIGDRVLVKQTQPGTLMFKGETCFDSGHWAGVALDKAEGDHAGTYKGVKYFECAQHCGIFVRPDEISHLLEANKNGSSSTGDEDSDSFYDDESFKRDCKYPEVGGQGARVTEQKAEDTKSAGGSEVPEKQSRLYVALQSGKGQKFLHSDHWKCDEHHHQNNLMCLGSDKEKTDLIQIKQGMLADGSPKEKICHADGINTSKNVCCLVEDQKRNKLTDDIAAELSKKLLFDALIAFTETAQHKYKSAFEKDVMNYIKGLKQEGSQKQFLIKENPVASLTEQSAKVLNLLLHDFNMLSIHGCHTVAERIVTKFVHDAVKEYKKIKRKQGVKTDKIFPSSSETSPITLPFLTKILDAGVFGSSKDFDQPNSDERALERQTQKQYLYRLDQWHSAPWKKTEEVPLVVPHYTSYVKNLAAYAVEELWTPENVYSNFTRTSVPKDLKCNDFPGNDLETESKRMYNQVIFDLTYELLRAEYQVTANPNTFPWLRENLRSCCSRCHCRRTEVDEAKTFVQGEIIKIMNLERNDLERKRKFLNMTKYTNCERDRVDLILIQELHKEESQWTYYDDDELTVKMNMTEDIFDSLILDTIRVLNKIYLRKASD
ncbi:coiled-coil domain-containing protein 187 isoform X3 [Numida meleagris]|uniref:coiled-coil domain-containing protein 187 isoform X3 n=1 Tax=Numida meleagris TaxID=8996 RepID=UPI000B3E3E3B|nr:coiled-coil domain-containing protein 187 isoform X3 [Numida meleagris]